MTNSSSRFGDHVAASAILKFNIMKLWTTTIDAIDPNDGMQKLWAGPHVPGETKEDAELFAAAPRLKQERDELREALSELCTALQQMPMATDKWAMILRGPEDKARAILARIGGK